MKELYSNGFALSIAQAIEEMKAEAIAEAEKRPTSNAKPGSLAAKANMVSDYNNRKNK